MQRIKCVYVFCKVKRVGNLTVQSTVIDLAGSVIDMLYMKYIRSVARILSDVVRKKEQKKKVENRQFISVKNIYVLLFRGYQKDRIVFFFFFAIFSVRLYILLYVYTPFMLLFQNPVNSCHKYGRYLYRKKTAIIISRAKISSNCGLLIFMVYNNGIGC